MRNPRTPRYVLTLDELPSVVEADGRMHPVFMKPRDVARLFDVTTDTVRTWVVENGLPALRVGTHIYIEVPALKAWIEERREAYAAAMQPWDDDESASPDEVLPPFAQV